MSGTARLAQTLDVRISGVAHPAMVDHVGMVLTAWSSADHRYCVA